jgi:hypothetical protein
MLNHKLQGPQLQLQAHAGLWSLSNTVYGMAYNGS